ncbi:hypothetical protein LMH73_014445 [Vibrio splendidus]|nr:hypothetical protein [Vibrio splendidus]MCC4882506.1 hypothetical protein [Vibrio splendidus]
MIKEIKVTPKQMSMINMHVKQLLALHLKKPTEKTTQEKINSTITTVGNRFSNMFDVVE